MNNKQKHFWVLMALCIALSSAVSSVITSHITPQEILINYTFLQSSTDYPTLINLSQKEQSFVAEKQAIIIQLGFGNTTDCHINNPDYNGYDSTYLLPDSKSMEPCLTAGDKVYLKKVPFNELREGYVVAFRLTHEPCYVLEENGYYVTNCLLHRLIIETDKGYVSKGDNAPFFDYVLVTPENYIGLLVKTQKAEAEHEEVWNTG